MRKTNKILAAVIVLLMAMSIVFTGCTAGGPSMKISIEGVEFQLDCKVSDILNAGFELADIDHPGHIMKDFPELDARTLVQEGLFIYKNGEASNVAIFVYNKSVETQRLEDCNVYCFKYDCGTYSQNAGNDNCLKVLFNGIDMRFTDRQKVLTALEGQDFHFKDADKTDFLKSGDAYSKSLIGATNTQGSFLTIFNDYNYESGERTVNGFEFKLSIKYDTSGA